MALAIAGVLAWHGTASAQTHRVALVIDHGSSWSGPRLLWKCVEFAQQAINGLSLLQLAGVNSAQPPEIYDWGGGAYTVCQIAGEPRQIPDRCFGPMSGPNWSDWHATSAGWVPRSTGTGGYSVQDGDLEGWTYSVGTGTRPPAISFSQVCTAPAVTHRASPTGTLAPARASAIATVTATPPLEAVAPSISPTARTALASTGPPTKPPTSALPQWLPFGGAMIFLSGLAAINLRRRRP